MFSWYSIQKTNGEAPPVCEWLLQDPETRRRLVKWMVTLSIGLFTGIAAYFIEGSIGLLVQWRRDLMDVIEWPATSGNLAKAWFMFTCWNLVLVVCVSYVVCTHAP